jgi:hypothetical protein
LDYRHVVDLAGLGAGVSTKSLSFHFNAALQFCSVPRLFCRTGRRWVRRADDRPHLRDDGVRYWNRARRQRAGAGRETHQARSSFQIGNLRKPAQRAMVNCAVALHDITGRAAVGEEDSWCAALGEQASGNGRPWQILARLPTSAPHHFPPKSGDNRRWADVAARTVLLHRADLGLSDDAGTGSNEVLLFCCGMLARIPICVRGPLWRMTCRQPNLVNLVWRRSA